MIFHTIYKFDFLGLFLFLLGGDCGPLMWSHVCLLGFNELRVWCEFTYHFTSLLLFHIFELGLDRKKTQMDFHGIFLSCTLLSVLLAHGDSFCLLFFFLPSLQVWLLARNYKYDGSRRVPGRKYAHSFFFDFFCFSKYVLCGVCLTLLYSGNA